MKRETSNASRRRVSSGIPELDRLLGDLCIGDNVLWYEDTGGGAAVFTLNFIKESLARKKPLIYVTFDRSPKNVVSFLGLLAESQNLTILDCFTNGKGDRSEVFNRFYEQNGALWPHKVIKVNDPTNPAYVGDAIYGLHSTMSGDVHFILDSLTGMQSLWGEEELALNFYDRTCPRLYELDTIAYWLIEKGAHSNRFKANINKIAQVAIDLSVHREKSYLKIIKAENRSSNYLNENHEFLCEEATILFESQKQISIRFNLGETIKDVRLKRGLSQRQLADMTGVTPSTISQVEKNLIYPSLTALFRIAESLSVNIASLFKGNQADRDSVLYPSEERTPTPLEKIPKRQAIAELVLPPDCELPVEVTLVKIKPGRKLKGHFFAHKGKEMGYLLSGHLEMNIDNRSFQVQPGDAVVLCKEFPSTWQNLSDKTTELLWFRFK